MSDDGSIDFQVPERFASEPWAEGITTQDGFHDKIAEITTPKEFSVPDEYKEEGWSKNVKSQDDLWKSYSESQKLIGKKQVPFNYDEATPEDIDKYKASIRPESPESYDFFDEGAEPENVKFIQSLLHKAGVPKAMGKELVEGLNAKNKEKLEAMYSKDGFVKQMTSSFGEDYTKTVGLTNNLIKRNLNDADRKLVDNATNEQLGVMYRLVNNIMKTHGIKESDANVGGGASSMGEADKAAVRKEIRESIAGLVKRPHTAEEKAQLLKRLNESYK